MPIPVNLRTAALGAAAAALVAATIYDQTVGFGDAADRAPAAESPGKAARRTPAPDQAAILAREVAELEHFLAAAPLVRARYQAIAVPYAEAVATFATLYGEGESLPGLARARVTALLPPNVKVEEMLVSEPAAAGAGASGGATWLTATLNLSSGDSDAFQKTLIRLGDAANGMAWKELAVVSDPERRSLRASGLLALLMVKRAE
jgi:hypothetical protein